MVDQSHAEGTRTRLPLVLSNVDVQEGLSGENFPAESKAGQPSGPLLERHAWDTHSYTGLAGAMGAAREWSAAP